MHAPGTQAATCEPHTCMRAGCRSACGSLPHADSHCQQPAASTHYHTAFVRTHPRPWRLGGCRSSHRSQRAACAAPRGLQTAAAAARAARRRQRSWLRAGRGARGQGQALSMQRLRGAPRCWRHWSAPPGRRVRRSGQASPGRAPAAGGTCASCVLAWLTFWAVGGRHAAVGAAPVLQQRLTTDLRHPFGGPSSREQEKIMPVLWHPNQKTQGAAGRQRGCAIFTGVIRRPKGRR